MANEDILTILEQRLGLLDARQRLGIGKDHQSQLFDQGIDLSRMRARCSGNLPAGSGGYAPDPVGEFLSPPDRPWGVLWASDEVLGKGPLDPQKRTFVSALSMSALCQ